MRRLGISMEELSKSRLVIQGFNQKGQRVISMIRLDVTIDELKARPLFHVINSKTSYNLLLGQPRIHGNGVVPSTLHQCFKYCDGKQVQVVTANLQPFTMENLTLQTPSFTWIATQPTMYHKKSLWKKRRQNIRKEVNPSRKVQNLTLK